MKTETPERRIAPMKSCLMNAPIMTITRIAKRAITIFPTNRSRRSNSSAQKSQTGAVNFTDWWRLNRMKCPYRYAEVSRVCVTSQERQREHSCGLNLFGIVLVLKYIGLFSSIFLATSKSTQPYQLGRASITGLMLNLRISM